MCDEPSLVLKLKWATARPIRNARDYAALIHAEPRHSNRCRTVLLNSSSGSIFAGTTLRHEGACRLLADGVDIRIIQLMLGHASTQKTHAT